VSFVQESRKEGRNLGILKKATKRRTCREHKEFNNGAATVLVVGFLQSLSKDMFVNKVLVYNEWLLKQKLRV